MKKLQNFGSVRLSEENALEYLASLMRSINELNEAVRELQQMIAPISATVVQESLERAAVREKLYTLAELREKYEYWLKYVALNEVDRQYFLTWLEGQE